MHISTAHKKRTILSLIASIAILVTGFISPANAIGGSTGVIFISDSQAGTVWVGDISGSPMGKEAFWSATGSAIDQVATTNTMVAWSSSEPTDLQYGNKLFIAPIAHEAANVVTVSFLDNVQALASDPSGELFFAVSDGKIWKINSDGTGKVEVANDPDNLTENFWALAYDATNRILYSGNDAAWTITKYQLDANKLNGGSGEVIITDGFVEGIDGLFVNPATGRLTWSKYSPEIGVHAIDVDSSDYVFMFATETYGAAPSGMVISDVTSKMYFTVEQALIETNLDGSSPRTLYTSGVTGNGFQGFAIAFGIDLPPASFAAPTITSIDPEEGPVAGGTEVTITGTGFRAGATVLIGGVECEVVSISSTQIVCTTGAHSAATVNVRVTNTDEQYDVENNSYTYVADNGNGGGGNGGGDPDPEPGSVVKFSKTVYFGADSAAISSSAKKILKKIAARIPSGATNVKIKISSFVKKAKSEVNGNALAKARAKSVSKYLKTKLQDADFNSVPNGKGTSTSNSARKAVIKVTYTTPVV